MGFPDFYRGFLVYNKIAVYAATLSNQGVGIHVLLNYTGAGELVYGSFNVNCVLDVFGLSDNLQIRVDGVLITGEYLREFNKRLFTAQTSYFYPINYEHDKLIEVRLAQKITFRNSLSISYSQATIALTSFYYQFNIGVY